MNLITGNNCDFLNPTHGIVPYYDKFILQYTCIVTSTLVSQCNLMPDMFDETELELDNHIDNFIEMLPENALLLRKQHRYLSKAVMIDIGHLIQDEESRTFISDNFIEKAKSIGISSRNLVIRTMNAYAFVNYFSLLEDTLRNVYFESIEKTKRRVMGKDTISLCLQEKLKKIKKTREFEMELRVRSKFFNNFDSLSSFWVILNFIRNRQAHHNSFYDEDAQKILSDHLDVFLEKNHSEELLMENHMFTLKIEKIILDIKETGQLVFTDALENIIRNTSIFIMESLYKVETNSY